jgi:ribonuclease P protein component
MSLSFPKAEKLCGKREIAALVTHGRRGGSGCLRYCFLPNTLEYSRILVSVPKKHFKRAVKRNLLKRRIREAFRLQKDLLQDGLPSRYDILFTYVDNEIADYGTIRAAVAAILSEIRRQGTGS